MPAQSGARGWTGLDRAWGFFRAGGAFLVGFGPFTAYLLTRLAGLPGDPGDFGNWGDPLGTASLLVEGTLMVIAISAILHLARGDRGLAAGAAAPTGQRPRERTRVLARTQSDAA